jgi:hypothetical protein
MKRNIPFLSVLGFLAIAMLSSACASAPTAVGNDREAQIVVNRVDDDTSGKMFISIDYGDDYQTWPFPGTLMFGAKNGSYKIYARYSIDTGTKNSQGKPVIENYYSVKLSFDVKNDKHSFYVEYLPKTKDVIITDGTSGAIDADNLDSAIEDAFKKLSNAIPEKSKIALVNVSAKESSEGEYVIDELTVLFVNARGFSIVDRKNLDAIKSEQNFQLTGDVDDDSVVSIGKLLGAEVVITGSIDGTGETRRLRLKALDVRTGLILEMTSGKI